MIKKYLPYDPGQLPTKPAPAPGESITFSVKGLPPFKDRPRSIRNPNHPKYSSFVALREAAIKAMNGHAWSHGKVRVNLEIHCKSGFMQKSPSDYYSGMLDTLGGSHGHHFTYLPIIFNDDHSVVGGVDIIEYEKTWYRVKIKF